jgi:glycosyltransferase involved in cell wall biosynthesis
MEIATISSSDALSSPVGAEPSRGSPSAVAPVASPLVSVIIPCFQQGRYLATAIESCLEQTYPAVEVIVVNDGSKDETESVARRYGCRVVYVHRPNGGHAAARNTGISAASGAYVKFLDADDHVHPEQIRWQVDALAGRTDAVSLTAVRLYRDGHPEEFADHVPQARALLPDLFRDIDWGGTHGFLLPMALVRKAGDWDESLRYHADWDYLVRVGLLGPELLTDARVGAYYRQHAGTVSTNRAGVAAVRARRLVALHDLLRAGPRGDWFGPDLLGSEQRAYRALLQMKVREPGLRQALLTRIAELQARLGTSHIEGRFRHLVRWIGYAPAEQIRYQLMRLLGLAPVRGEAWPADPFRAALLRLVGLRRPVPSIDVAPWRECTTSPN